MRELIEARGGASHGSRASRNTGKYTPAQQEAEAALCAATARLEDAAARLALVESTIESTAPSAAAATAPTSASARAPGVQVPFGGGGGSGGSGGGGGGGGGG